MRSQKGIKVRLIIQNVNIYEIAFEVTHPIVRKNRYANLCFGKAKQATGNPWVTPS